MRGFRTRLIRRGCLAWLVAAAAITALSASPRQDKPAATLTPYSSPVLLEEGRLFSIGGLLTASVRNRHPAPVLVTLRAWVFDQNGRLKGTNSLCTGEWFPPGVLRSIVFPLEVRDLSPSDAVAVTIDEVTSERERWVLRETISDQVQVARARALGSSGRLSFETARLDGPPPTACPCECPTIATSCETYCQDTGLRAFTCTPADSSGCSASCTCK